MEEPNINDKKYKYFHKKLGKMMINNQKYFADVKLFKEQNSARVVDSSRSFCECGSEKDHDCKYCTSCNRFHSI